jgi:endo-1,4-beta-xylanase
MLYRSHHSHFLLFQNYTRHADSMVGSPRVYTRFRRTVSSIFLFLILALGLLPLPSVSQPLANGKNKFLGNAITYGSSIPSNFAKYWNQVTPGNDGKWGSVETSQGVYNWTGLDNIYNFALSNGFLFKDHNLIWGSQQPSFITSLDSATQRTEVENWIHLVGQKYPQMSFIDVVNEPFNSPPPYKNALGGSGTTGWDWVVTAFKWARQYCASKVKLLINEYNILQDNGITSNYIALIDTLKVRGLIDGIGIQGHYFEFKSAAGLTPVYSYPINTLKSNLDRIATATGLPIYISEFDINEADDNTQLQNYQTYFSLFWQDSGVKGMTLWGYNQGDTWKPNAYLVRADQSERPALQWLRTYVLKPPIPTIISPVSVSGTSCNPSLVWQASNSAVSYHVQVATDMLFPASSIVVETTIVDTLLQLSPLAANTAFYWHVNAANDDGTSDYSPTALFITGNQITSVDALGEIPKKFNLDQNYPNPFNPSTTIRYEIPKNAYVRIAIYDVLGKVVATLVDGVQSANRYSVEWNPSRLSSGIYLCRIQAHSQDGSDNFNSVKKLLFMK